MSASWTQPSATCTAGEPTFSAMWVGLGGYSSSAQALEQIGTEVDCTASGRVASSAWFELVPAASRTISRPVRPGDRLRARVTVSGRQVSMRLTDITRHWSYSRRRMAAVVDASSAEWIVEAPSECDRTGSCQTLPLADFGATAFTGASATSASGASGSISSRRWMHTKIVLVPKGRRFVGSGGSSGAGGTARPSRLTASGSAFAVTYSSGGTYATRRVSTGFSYVEH